MKKEKATEAALSDAHTSNDTSASSQRARVIHALRTGAKTTLELRAGFNVLSPAPRIFELKARGWGIDKTTVKAYTPDGVLHTGIARYYLAREPIAETMATEVPPKSAIPAAQSVANGAL
jgi:Helix-turn-helix domain